MPTPLLHLTLPAWSKPYQARIGQTFASREARMALAIELAQQNVDHGSGGPFGAALFDGQGRLVSIGMNLVPSSRCAVLHAEIVALILAEQALDRYDLSNGGSESFELVTSTEPCTMCLGAVIWSGVKTLVCGARDEDARAIGFDEGPKPHNCFAELERRGITVIRGLLQERAVALLRDYGSAGLLIYNAGSRGSMQINPSKPQGVTEMTEDTDEQPPAATPPHSDTSASPLNEAAVNILIQLMGDGFATLKQTFINNAGKKLAALNRALASNDIETIKLLVHSLKGSCGTIGASGMAAMAKRIEDAIEANNPAIIQQLLQELELLFKETATKLEAYPIPQ